ncbi:MAG: inner-membrane translocator [Bdellovibrionota bacterium]
MMNLIRRNGAWIGFFVLAIVLTIATEGSFMSARNLTNLMRQTTLNGVLAAGMTLVILTGGIDLSIGSLVALAGIAVGFTQITLGWSAYGVEGALASAACALLVGLLAGVLNGALIARLRIAPFVITLGMMVVARGLALIVSGGASLSPMSEVLDPLANGFLSPLLTAVLLVVIAGGFARAAWVGGRKGWADLLFPLLVTAGFGFAFLTYRGFPILGLFLVAVIGITGFLMVKTTFGRSIYAIGSNERAAFWAGVPVRSTVFWVYALMGLLSGLAGLLLTARLNGADPNAGQLFELDAIAAVVIGGTSLRGGQGSVIGSLAGALTIATLNNGMDLMGVPSFYQMVLKGVIIIVAVTLDRSQRAA